MKTNNWCYDLDFFLGPPEIEQESRLKAHTLN